MDILHRIKAIIIFSGLSVRAFALKCNLSQTTLDKQVKGLRGISIETTIGILNAFPEISAEWLLRGEGEMIKSEVASKEMDRITKLNGVIESLQEVIDVKNSAIVDMTEQIKQLELQLNN